MVNKTWIIIRSCLKKSLKQVIAIFILTISVSLILNMLLTILMDYKNNFRNQVEELNSSTFTAVFYDFTDSDKYDGIVEELEKNENIVDYQIEKVISGNGTINYGAGLFNNIITIERFNENKKIDKYEILSQSEKTSGVYLSYIFDVTIGLKFGDHISAKINNKKYDFEVLGFYNCPTTGTINCTDISIYATDDIYDAIKEDTNSYRLSVKLGDCNVTTENSKIVESIGNAIPSLVLLDVNIIDNIETARYTNSSLFEGIMLVACIILSIVLLAIIAIVLSNYIRNNIINFGTLKAVGYSSRSLITPLVICFIIVTLVGSVIGVGLSYLVLPIVNVAMEKQVGIPYEIHFLIYPVLITILICVILCTITSYLSIRKIKSIAPINAIREEKTKISKIGNAIKFEKFNLNINFKIGINALISGINRTLILFFSFIAIAFLLGFSVFLYQNVIVDNTYTVNLICGQVCDSMITILPNEEEKLKEELEKDERTVDYYLYTVVTICPKDLDKIKAYVIEKDCEYINNDLICLEGHMPMNDNDMAVNGAYALKNNIKLNDKICIESDNGLIEYNVTGITQGAFYAGLDCYLTREAYKRISEIEFLTYYVDIDKIENINSFNDDISDRCMVFATVNEYLSLESIIPLYTLVLNILCIVIVSLCIIISCFILYILISIMLENKRREHGILKSTGYTSKNILFQTIVSIAPECILGILVGLMLSRSGSGFLITVPIKNIGIFRFGNFASWYYLVIAGVVLILITLIVIVLLSRSIKKISPHQLFNRE